MDITNIHMLKSHGACSIYSSAMKHLNDKNILNEQHGFRNNRSCESQLLKTMINDFAAVLNDKAY